MVVQRRAHSWKRDRLWWPCNVNYKAACSGAWSPNTLINQSELNGNCCQPVYESIDARGSKGKSSKLGKETFQPVINIPLRNDTCLRRGNSRGSCRFQTIAARGLKLWITGRLCRSLANVSMTPLPCLGTTYTSSESPLARSPTI